MSELGDLEDGFVVDDLKPGIHCKSCGAKVWPPPRKTVHRPGCDIDRTVTADIRYRRRLPAETRRAWGKARHAKRLAAGLCGNCGAREPRAGKKTCQVCADYWKGRDRR